MEPQTQFLNGGIKNYIPRDIAKEIRELVPDCSLITETSFLDGRFFTGRGVAGNVNKQISMIRVAKGGMTRLSDGGKSEIRNRSLNIMVTVVMRRKIIHLCERFDDRKCKSLYARKFSYGMCKPFGIEGIKFTEYKYVCRQI